MGDILYSLLALSSYWQTTTKKKQRIEHQHHMDGVDENWQCDRLLVLAPRTLKLCRFCDTMSFNIFFFLLTVWHCCCAPIYIVHWRKVGRIMNRNADVFQWFLLLLSLSPSSSTFAVRCSSSTNKWFNFFFNFRYSIGLSFCCIVHESSRYIFIVNSR